ncbi:MAG: cell envelope biogenesis protein TolA [Pseudomonadota bacterium]
MSKLITVLLASLFATSSFAAAHAGAPMTSAAASKPVEAMKAGDPKAQNAAQAKVDSRVALGDKSAKQPEAMKAGSEKAQAKAEAKKNAKVKSGKKNSTDAQMASDAKKL